MAKISNRAVPSAHAFRSDEGARLVAALPLAFLLSVGLWSAIVTAAIHFVAG